MDENKQITPSEEITDTETLEVVANATTEKATADVAENSEKKTMDIGVTESNVAETEKKSIFGLKPKKAKGDKQPMPKKKKIIIITAASVIGVIVLSLFIWLMVMFFGPSATQDLSSIPLQVEMGNKYYIGSENNTQDYSKIFPDGSDFSLSGSKLTFKQDGKTVTKDVTIVDGAVNVYTFEELAANVNAGKKVVIQNANLKAPKLEGKAESDVLKMEVTNDIYGNGATVNVNEIVATRVKGVTGGKIAAKSDGSSYSDKYAGGYSAFTIMPTKNQIIFQDVHIIGNDMSNKENGDLFGLTDEQITARGVKLFSGYGDLMYIGGDSDGKANVKVYHCVVENGHKVVHVRNANLDIEGTIIRNASDTALSVATFESEKSTINSKNNVILNSLTGAILFYSFEPIAKAKEKETWNELNVEGFLDIYNWKAQDGLAFLPETEGAYEGIANKLVGGTIQAKKYDELKAVQGGKKYIHFAILKIRTNNGGVAYNGSTVNFKNDIKYKTSKDKGFEKGFPIPSLASGIMYDIDVWGYYDEAKGDVKPTDGLSEKMLDNLYKELVEGRK